MDQVADFIVDKLNTISLDQQDLKFSRGTMIILTGVHEGHPYIGRREINFNPLKSIFEKGERRESTKAGIIMAVPPVPLTESIIQEPLYQHMLKESSDNGDPDLPAQRISYLIRQIKIRSGESSVGGLPSILIIKTNDKPRWFERATTCPELP